MRTRRYVLCRAIAALAVLVLLGITPGQAEAQAPNLYLPFDGVHRTTANVDHECPFYGDCQDGAMTFYTGEGCTECQDLGQAWTAPYCYRGIPVPTTPTAARQSSPRRAGR